MASNRIPMRNIGALGINRDIPAYDLPPTALSNGNNVRFEAPGIVRRAPGFRTLLSGTTASPDFIFAVRPDDSFDFIVSADADGRLYKYDGSEIDISEAGFTPTAAIAGQRFTGAFLDQCTYINRSDGVPRVLLRSGSQVQPLTDYGWDTNWRTGAIRAWRDSLVAFDMTENGTRLPLKVRISDAVDGSALPPASWDETVIENNLAFATTLPDATGRLLDGLPLRESFYLYSQSEVWRVTFQGGILLYEVDRVFSDRGILSTNCVVEADGRHYVWEEGDIYVHDGITPVSIADNVIREFLQRTANSARAKERNFVFHSKLQDEILFCYIGGDDDAGFPGTDYPNRAAVWDLVTKTWSFRDLPSVSSMAEIVITEASPWDAVTGTWAETGGYWDAREQSATPALVCTSRSDAPGLPAVNRYYGHDLLAAGSLLPAPLDPLATKPAFIERVGWDIDEAGEELLTYKSITRLMPQAQMFNNSDAVFNVSVNAQLFPDGDQFSPDFGPVTFDPRTEYKLDFRGGGRYIGYRVEVEEPVDFKFSGMDMEYVTRGRR